MQRISIRVVDENGNVYTGQADLIKQSGPTNNGRDKKGTRVDSNSPFDYSLPIKAFMNNFGRKLSGHGKFALLIAYYVKGKPGVEVGIGKVISEWNKMKSILGSKFNPAFPNRALTSGLVDQKRKGVYVLIANWAGRLK